MAAGLYNVSRRRYSHHYEEESRVFSTDVYHKKDLSQSHNCWGSERRLTAKSLSSSVNYGGRSFSQGERKGTVAGTLNREHGGVYGGGSRSSNCSKEIPMSEDGASMPPEKKRKFSPVVWDRDEMQVRISSKNRIVPVSSVFSPPLARKIVVGVLDFQSFVGTERHSFAAREIEDVQITPVELPVGTSTYGVGMSLSPVDQTDTSSPKMFCADNQKPEMKNGLYIEDRNIYKSKWAYVESPSASRESGELSLESSEESRDDSLGSAGEVPVIRPASGDEQSKNEFHIRDDMEFDDPIDDISPVHSCSKDEEDLGMIQGEEVMKQRRFDMLQGCRSVYKYERLNKISEGTYGVVFRAKNKETGEIVALKKVKMGNARCGFPVSALREINILMSLQHSSIVEVKEVVMDDRDGVFMVMQYLDHELKGLMDTMKQPFSQSEVKCLMIQLLEGLSYLHDNWVLHRDLKTSNLLLSSKGELKICDFGLSRRYGRPIKPYTPLVVTLWYRAPELLLGVKEYSTAVDMWSVGCIMAELLAKKPLFNGQKELEQLNKIFNTLGTPDVAIWPGYMSLPGIRGNFVKQPYNRLRKIFPAATFTGSPVLTELGFDLLSKLLTYDPERRITAADALNHGWFREFPLPSEHVKIRK